MNRLFLSPPHMSGREQECIAKVFESNYIAPLGAFVDEFEQRIIEYTGTSYALALSSATAALHLALRVLGVGAGDEVLASTFTFIGSINAILYQQATPVFIDSDEKSWNLDPNLLREYLLTCKHKPKALILTHLYGQCADLEAIISICREFEIFVIEDSAESLGATYEDKQSGTLGDMGVYSFNGNKILTTSGGGMLVSDNAVWIQRAKFYATQAREAAAHYEHREYGYNYRMSNVLAAIGVAQMEVLAERVLQKRQIFEWYQRYLGDEVMMPELPNTRGNRWLTTILLKQENPQTVIKRLEVANCESRPLWKPMHLQPLFKDAKCVVSGVSERLFKQGLCLPSGTAMSEKDVQYVCKAIYD